MNGIEEAMLQTILKMAQRNVELSQHMLDSQNKKLGIHPEDCECPLHRYDPEQERIEEELKGTYEPRRTSP